jgi:hypothetical protein
MRQIQAEQTRARQMLENQRNAFLAELQDALEQHNYRRLSELANNPPVDLPDSHDTKLVAQRLA